MKTNISKALIEGTGAFVIAETASSHEGSVETAKKLAKAAADSGADAVKFQIFSINELFVKNHHGFKAMKGIEFNDKEWEDILDYAGRLGVAVLVDAFDSRCLDFDGKIDAYKIPSTNASNPGLVSAVAKTGKPVLLGTGGCSIEDVKNAVKTVKSSGNENIVIMAGFQGFPTRIEDSNITRIAGIRKGFGLPVGFSDHVDAENAIAKSLPVALLALGAHIIEKHITLDRSRKGRDYYSALNPDEFREMVDLVKQAGKALGSGSLELSDAEKDYGKKMKKFIVAGRNIRAGERLAGDMFAFKRSQTAGLAPSHAEALEGVAKRDIKEDETIGQDDFAKAAVLIAARMNSKRLPKKATAVLEGMTVIEHLIERVRTSSLPSSIVLCTSTHPDDKILIDIAKKSGIKWFAGSEDDVLDRFIKAAERECADVVVRVTGDNPLVDAGYIDKMLEEHVKSGADYTNVVGLPAGTKPEIMSLSALQRAHEMAANSDKSEYMTLYFTKSGSFKTCSVEAEPGLKRPDYRLALDAPEDLKLLKEIFSRRYSKGKQIPLIDIVKLLDGDPGLLKINSCIVAKNVKGVVAESNAGKKIRIVGD
jgi:N,N'-diacetyllegionaminate synthase